MAMHKTFIGIVASLLTLLGCVPERKTSVEVMYRSGVEFRITGSGKLAYFAVYKSSYPQMATEPNDPQQALWVFTAKGEPGYVEHLNEFGYGKVPDGYIQEFPRGAPPEPLKDGEKYYFHADTLSAPGFSGYLQVNDHRASIVEGEHVCFAESNGKWIRRPCEK